MFTGIVEEMGTIRSIRRGAHSAVLSIGAELVLSDLKIGDCVAVNGVCLTATGKDSGGFTADVMHETLNRSSLGTLVPGSRVNLERAMAATAGSAATLSPATSTAPEPSPPCERTTTPSGTPFRQPLPCCGTLWRRAPSPSTASA